ncbi:MAG TPA: hypothetical protein VKF17_11205 [Isosphaeraceae bacterium]|nr:hypothetical protein [Isosphaeraceae bacterium]
MRILAPGGGSVSQQVHNIMANVPPENIIAMFDAVRADQEPPGTWESPFTHTHDFPVRSRLCGSRHTSD